MGLVCWWLLQPQEDAACAVAVFWQSQTPAQSAECPGQGPLWRRRASCVQLAEQGLAGDLWRRVRSAVFMLPYSKMYMAAFKTL